MAATEGMELPAPDSPRMQAFMAHALDLSDDGKPMAERDEELLPLPVMPEVPDTDPVTEELAALVAKSKQEQEAE